MYKCRFLYILHFSKSLSGLIREIYDMWLLMKKYITTRWESRARVLCEFDEKFDEDTRILMIFWCDFACEEWSPDRGMCEFDENFVKNRFVLMYFQNLVRTCWFSMKFPSDLSKIHGKCIETNRIFMKFRTDILGLGFLMMKNNKKINEKMGEIGASRIALFWNDFKQVWCMWIYRVYMYKPWTIKVPLRMWPGPRLESNEF